MSATSAGATDRELLEELVARVRAVERIVRQIAVPVELLTAAQACDLLKVSRRGLQKMTDRGLFSDARPVDKRVPGSARLYYADEVQLYIKERTADAVRRFRREAGRLRW